MQSIERRSIQHIIHNIIQQVSQITAYHFTNKQTNKNYTNLFV